MVNDTLIREIKQYADAVPDYRHPSYTKHLLGDIIMIVFFVILGNANEWGEIESFAKRKEIKESYKLSMKRIRFELSLDYENEVERILSMIDIENIKKVLQSTGKSPLK